MRRFLLTFTFLAVATFALGSCTGNNGCCGSCCTPSCGTVMPAATTPPPSGGGGPGSCGGTGA